MIREFCSRRSRHITLPKSPVTVESQCTKKKHQIESKELDLEENPNKTNWPRNVLYFSWV